MHELFAVKDDAIAFPLNVDGNLKHHQLKSLRNQRRYPWRHWRSTILHPRQCSSLKVQSFQVQLDYEQVESTERNN